MLAVPPCPMLPVLHASLQNWNDDSLKFRQKLPRIQELHRRSRDRLSLMPLGTSPCSWCLKADQEPPCARGVRSPDRSGRTQLVYASASWRAEALGCQARLQCLFAFRDQHGKLQQPLVLNDAYYSGFVHTLRRSWNFLV